MAEKFESCEGIDCKMTLETRIREIPEDAGFDENSERYLPF